MSLLLLGAGPATDAPPAPSNLYPDPDLASSDYTTAGGGVTKAAGSILFEFAGTSDSVSAIGDLATAINAALANNTAYTVEITVADHVANSDGCRISLKGSVFGIITPTGNGTFSTVLTTSNTGDIVITGRPVEDGTSFRITHISILPA